MNISRKNIGSKQTSLESYLIILLVDVNIDMPKKIRQKETLKRDEELAGALAVWWHCHDFRHGLQPLRRGDRCELMIMFPNYIQDP